MFRFDCCSGSGDVVFAVVGFSCASWLYRARGGVGNILIVTEEIENKSDATKSQSCAQEILNRVVTDQSDK